MVREVLALLRMLHLTCVPINVKPTGGGRWGIGRGFDQLLWPGGRVLNYLAVPGVGIFEFLFVPMITKHFLGWGISVYLTSHFCPG